MVDTVVLADELSAQVEAIVDEDAEPFDVDSELLLGGWVDSLGVVELVEWLETRLDIEIDPGDVLIENFRSIRAMVDYVHERLAATP